jgi:hypothetical protein
MSHKAKGLGRKRCRNKKKGSLSLGSYQAGENSVFSVLREVRSNGRLHLSLNKSEYANIVTVN